MSFLVDLASVLKNVFAKKTHTHSEFTDYNSHLGNYNNPHAVTKEQVGLGNVTNDAQVKKAASSVDGNVVTWVGTTGDTLGGGYGVETTLVGDTNKLATAAAIKSYVDNLSSGIGGIVAGGTQSITTLRAIDTTDAQLYPDKILINVEEAGLYRLDRQSTATDDGNQVIQPTVGVGRWLKMTSVLSEHNLLDNKQGGAANEYYHLSASQFGSIPTGVSAANKLVAEDNVKLSKLRSDGTIWVNDIYYTSADLQAFENALNS